MNIKRANHAAATKLLQCKTLLQNAFNKCRSFHIFVSTLYCHRFCRRTYPPTQHFVPFQYIDSTTSLTSCTFVWKNFQQEVPISSFTWHDDTKPNRRHCEGRIWVSRTSPVILSISHCNFYTYPNIYLYIHTYYLYIKTVRRRVQSCLSINTLETISKATM